MQRLLKMTLLAAMGIFLITRITSGAINFYINQRFVPLTVLAAVGTAALAFGYWRQGEHHHDNHDHEDHDHDHNLTWIGLFIVMLPIILGYIVQPHPLGAAAMNNREISVGTLSSVAPPSGNDSMGLVAGEKNIMDWLGDFQRTNINTIAGEEAHVIGFVYRDERFAPNTFMVSRFVLSCCVADAAPVGLVVQTPNAADFADDVWVDVHGRFQPGTFNNTTMPILIADTIEKTDTPAQPYLYR